MTLEQFLAQIVGGDTSDLGPQRDGFMRQRRPVAPMPQAPQRYAGQRGALQRDPIPSFVGGANAQRSMVRPQPMPPQMLPQMLPQAPRGGMMGRLQGAFGDFEATRRRGMEAMMNGVDPQSLPPIGSEPRQVQMPPPAPPMPQRGVPLSQLQENRMGDAGDFASWANAEMGLRVPGMPQQQDREPWRQPQGALDMPVDMETGLIVDQLTGLPIDSRGRRGELNNRLYVPIAEGGAAPEWGMEPASAPNAEPPLDLEAIFAAARQRAQSGRLRPGVMPMGKGRR